MILTCKMCSVKKDLFIVTQIWDILPLCFMFRAYINNYNVRVLPKTFSLIRLNV